jgi:hypothetical protein
MKMGEPHQAKTRPLVLGCFERLQPLARRERDHIVPHLELFKHLDEALAPVSVGVGLALHRVELGMPGIGEEGPGHVKGRRPVAQVHPVPRQPFVVVGVVVNLIGQEAMLLHLGVIDAGRGLLVPGRILVAMQLRVDVPRHVPHVGDPRRGESELGCGVEGALRLALVPEMDAVVVRRVHRGLGKDLLQEGIDHLMTADGNPLPGELPDPHDEEGLRLNVIGKFMNQVLQIAQEFLGTLLVLVGFPVEVVGLRLDVGTLAGGCLLVQQGRLRDEVPGALLIFPVGHRHAPVGHRALRVVRGNLPKRALGFVIPEAVKLPEPLVEVGLPLRPGGGDRQVDLARALDQPGGLAWAFIEGMALVGVAGNHRLREQSAGKQEEYGDTEHLGTEHRPSQ